MPNSIKRAAIYIRVSTEEQALHGYSLEAQETALVQYANEHDLKIVKIYRDEGFSARKPATKRKKMQELLVDVEAGLIDIIIFTKLDRWFRSVRDYHAVQTILDKNNVVWRAILEDYQTETADGRLKVNIMLSVAENEADRTSERIKFVFANRVKNGEYCFGGNGIPIGYKKVRADGKQLLVKDPETEAAITAFWEKMIKYKNTRTAGREVNLEFGLRRAHKSWMSTVRNEIYTGEYRGVKEFCPAYISRKEWEALQHPELRIKSTQHNRCYLFVGLLRCPVCGNTLKANYKTYPNDRSKEYYSYRCNTTNLGYCTYSRHLSERKLERYLVSNIRGALEEYALKSEAKAAQRKKNRNAVDTAKLKEQLRRLNNIYMAGNISDSEYQEQAATVKRLIAEAEQLEEESTKPIRLDALRALLNDDFEAKYQELSREEKQRFWHEIISAIHFDDNQVSEITFKV